MCIGGSKPKIDPPAPPILQPPADGTDALPTLLVGSKRKKTDPNTSGYNAMKINLGSLPSYSGLTIGQG